LERQINDRQSAEPLSEAQRQQLLTLGEDLKAAWDHPNAPVALKKRILRTVVNEIVVEADAASEAICLHLHWVGGAHTTLRVRRNQPGMHRHVTDKAVVDLVRELAEVCGDRQTAGILNQLNCRTGAGNRWTVGRVRALRDRNHIPAFDASRKRSWLTLTEAAEELKVSQATVRKLIERRVLPAKQVVAHAPCCIQPGDLLLAPVQCYVKAVHLGKRPPPLHGDQREIPFL
jgi:hypothetical protein